MIILTPSAAVRFYGRDDSDKDCDIDVVKETWVENVYQIEAGDFHDTGIFVDLGANIGAVSLFVSKLERKEDQPDIKVYAYEPEPDNLTYLHKNINHNDCDNIEVIEKAVSNKRGSAGIVVQQGNSYLLKSNSPTDHLPAQEVVEIDMVTLEDVFKFNGIEECDVMKVDIEGSEYDIFCDAKESDLMRIKYLTMEFSATDKDTFGALIYNLARVFNLHVLGSPDRGGYLYGRRY